MLIESHVKFYSPQNICGASQDNSVAAVSLTTEVAGDWYKWLRAARLEGPRLQIVLKRGYLRPGVR